MLVFCYGIFKILEFSLKKYSINFQNTQMFTNFALLSTI